MRTEIPSITTSPSIQLLKIPPTRLPMTTRMAVSNANIAAVLRRQYMFITSDLFGRVYNPVTDSFDRNGQTCSSIPT